jgi:hypothetical protein
MRALFILAALLSGCASGDADRAALKEELKHEIMAELREPSAERSREAVPTGHVEGRILLQNEGVAGCRVRLVQLLESDRFLGSFEEARRGAEFSAVSDADGHFSFHDVPCGSYRVLWQPAGDSGWIRRLREKADAQVEVGKTARVRDIDLSHTPIGTGNP